MRFRPARQDEAYWAAIRAYAKLTDGDGCTGVPDFHKDCCREHDLHLETGLTLSGRPISTWAANAAFASCIQSRSRLGFFSPMAAWRWVSVTAFTFSLRAVKRLIL
tara:strand:+ start:885 stop:1202 length:318 start_codon:yes stop_codon:yes gene_type:complete